MLLVLSIVLPVFGLIAIGFAAVRSGLLPETAADGMGAFMYKIAVPVLVFRALAEADFPDRPDFAFWGAYFIGVAVAWTLAEWTARRLGVTGPTAIITGVSASFSNTVLIGIGLITQAFGAPGLVALFVLVAIHLPLLGFVITLRLEGGQGRISDIIWKTAKGLAKNPIILGIVTGTVFNLAGLGVPDLARPLIDPIASAAVPVALITAGVSLSAHLAEGVSRPVIAACAIKLLVMPAVVWMMAFYVFDVPPLWAAVAVLLAAAPAGINAYLFALPYPKAVPIASGAVALSTLFAVVTVSLWIALLAANGTVFRNGL
ncbi:MAG: AEC family transporter [Pseudomonadota bacterium]